MVLAAAESRKIVSAAANEARFEIRFRCGAATQKLRTYAAGFAVESGR